MSSFLGNKIKHDIQKSPHRQAHHPEKQLPKHSSLHSSTKIKNPQLKNCHQNFKQNPLNHSSKTPIENLFIKISRQRHKIHHHHHKISNKTPSNHSSKTPIKKTFTKIWRQRHKIHHPQKPLNWKTCQNFEIFTNNFKTQGQYLSSKTNKKKNPNRKTLPLCKFGKSRTDLESIRLRVWVWGLI